MKNLLNLLRQSFTASSHALLAGTVILTSTLPANAADSPIRRTGYWEFKASMVATVQNVMNTNRKYDLTYDAKMRLYDNGRLTVTSPSSPFEEGAINLDTRTDRWTAWQELRPVGSMQWAVAANFQKSVPTTLSSIVFANTAMSRGTPTDNLLDPALPGISDWHRTVAAKDFSAGTSAILVMNRDNSLTLTVQGPGGPSLFGHSIGTTIAGNVIKVIIKTK